MTLASLGEFNSLARDLIWKEQTRRTETILLHLCNPLTIRLASLVGIHRKVKMTVYSVFHFLLASEGTILRNLSDHQSNGHVILAPSSDIPHGFTLLLCRACRTAHTLAGSLDGLQRINDQKESLVLSKLVLAAKLVGILKDIRNLKVAGEVGIITVEKMRESRLLKLHPNLSPGLFAGIVQNNMTLRNQSISELKTNRRLTTTGKAGNHAAGRRPNPLTSEEGIDVLPTRLERPPKSVRNLDIGETSRFNGLRETVRGVVVGLVGLGLGGLRRLLHGSFPFLKSVYQDGFWF